jgi:2-succinyl-5-enolpyruvyl-6-hydroxy-3-cyclohexene-1-carboxylate synthase
VSAPNRNTLWARALVEELVAGGVTAVSITPGSRSTPLTVAFADHEDVRTSTSGRRPSSHWGGGNEPAR